MFIINIVAVISTLFVVAVNKYFNNGIKKLWNSKVNRQFIHIYT